MLRFLLHRAFRIRRRILRSEHCCVSRAFRRSLLVCKKSDSVVSRLAHRVKICLVVALRTPLVFISQAIDPLPTWHSRTRIKRAFECSVWSIVEIWLCSDRESNFLCGILQVEKMLMFSTAYRLQGSSTAYRLQGQLFISWKHGQHRIELILD